MGERSSGLEDIVARLLNLETTIAVLLSEKHKYELKTIIDGTRKRLPGLPRPKQEALVENVELSAERLRTLENLGIKDLSWTKDGLTLHFRVAATGVSEQQLVGFCGAEIEREASELIENEEAVRKHVLEVKRGRSLFDSSIVQYNQFYKYNGETYQIADANLMIHTYPSGGKSVDARMLPSTCTIEFPHDEWFVNARRFWPTAAVPTKESRFRMTFLKFDEDGELFDGENNLVQRGF